MKARNRILTLTSAALLASLTFAFVGGGVRAQSAEWPRAAAQQLELA